MIHLRERPFENKAPGRGKSARGEKDGLSPEDLPSESNGI